MRKEVTEIIFILDRSGSMYGLEDDTIQGFNSLVQKQREQAGMVLISTVLFDDRREVLHDRIAIEEIKDLTREDYYVRGSTALLDAIGFSIDHITKVHKKLGKNESPQKTLFIINTDGQENDSRFYGYEKVKHMVERKQEVEGWQFIFLGANIDAIKEAGRFGIKEDYAVNYLSDHKGTSLNYRVLSDAISDVRNNRPLSKKWKVKIEKDYEERK